MINTRLIFLDRLKIILFYSLFATEKYEETERNVWSSEICAVLKQHAKQQWKRNDSFWKVGYGFIQIII